MRYLVSTLLLLWALGLAAEPLDLPAPGPKATCPVCGMFVAKYPEWIGTVLYRDGHAHHFDGAKDLFKYLQDLSRWAPGHQAADIAAIGDTENDAGITMQALGTRHRAAIGVTEYYGLTRIDAHAAWYVIGSDVLGPMGHELIPLETEEDAKVFLKDHAGRRILRFDEVTLPLLKGLDDGKFD